MSEENKTQDLTVQTKPGAMSMGFGQRGAELRTLDDAFRIAKAVHMSGFSPLKTVEANFVAIQLGAEIGLPPMASVQSIYVINNRPAMYAEAALAVVEKCGLLEDFDEKIEGAGENRKAVCTVKRKGRKSYTVEFSIADARKAGLFAKNESNWHKYPDRMLRARALGFALKDRFKDALMGLSIAEEIQDITPHAQVVNETMATKKPATLDALEATLEQSKPEPAEITIDEAKQKEFDAAFEKHKKEETKLSKLKKEPEQMGLVP